MLSVHDRWLTTPPESNIPEMDVEDEERLITEIATEAYRKQAGPLISPDPFERWLRELLRASDTTHAALFEHYEDEIKRRWEAEHDTDGVRADHAYEMRRERQMEDR